MKARFDDDNFRRRVARASAATRLATATAINDIALEIAAKADELVPFDTGALSSSQKIENASVGDLTATISYGGPAAPYALVQHEDQELRHTAGRSAKYLERPARQVGQNLDKKIQSLVRKAL